MSTDESRTRPTEDHVHEEAEAFVEFATKARQTERAAKAEKAARTDFRWIEIEANLNKARRALQVPSESRFTRSTTNTRR